MKFKAGLEPRDFIVVCNKDDDAAPRNNHRQWHGSYRAAELAASIGG